MTAFEVFYRIQRPDITELSRMMTWKDVALCLAGEWITMTSVSYLRLYSLKRRTDVIYI